MPPHLLQGTPGNVPAMCGEPILGGAVADLTISPLATPLAVLW